MTPRGPGYVESYNPEYERATYGTARYPPMRRRFGTSLTELFHLVVAITVLTTAIVLWMNHRGAPLNYQKFNLVEQISVALGIAVTGFAFHELGHKIVAQHYGHWSEFRYSIPGLVFTALAGYIGLLIGVPGATWHTGSSPRDNGRISAAGPLVNLLIAFAAFPFTYTFTRRHTFLTDIADAVLLFNAVLAIFNLIPLGPLDGRKVLRWNPIIYAGLVAMAVVLFVYAQPWKSLEGV